MLSLSPQNHLLLRRKWVRSLHQLVVRRSSIFQDLQHSFWEVNWPWLWRGKRYTLLEVCNCTQYRGKAVASKWLPKTFGGMFWKLILICGLFAITAVSASSDRKIIIYSNAANLTTNDTTSWAIINSSAINTEYRTIDSFSICLRFRVRMFPNLPAFLAFGPGEEIDSESNPLRFYFGYSSNVHGPPRDDT